MKKQRFDKKYERVFSFKKFQSKGSFCVLLHNYQILSKSYIVHILEHNRGCFDKKELHMIEAINYYGAYCPILTFDFVAKDVLLFIKNYKKHETSNVSFHDIKIML